MLSNSAARARGETLDPLPVVKLYTVDAVVEALALCLSEK